MFEVVRKVQAISAGRIYESQNTHVIGGPEGGGGKCVKGSFCVGRGSVGLSQGEMYLLLIGSACTYVEGSIMRIYVEKASH